MRGFSQIKESELAYSRYIIFYQPPFQPENAPYDSRNIVQIRDVKGIHALLQESMAKKFWLYGIDLQNGDLHRIDFAPRKKIPKPVKDTPIEYLLIYKDGADNLNVKLNHGNLIKKLGVIPDRVLGLYLVYKTPSGEPIRRIPDESLEGLLK